MQQLGVFVKIAIISDIHANLAALQAFPEKHCDQIWCIGDLVDYGPRPHEIIQWIKEHADLAVRGNHDHAVGFHADPECSAPFKHLAAVTQLYTEGLCTPEDIHYLKDLPIQRETTVNSTKFYLVHAMPSDPLFSYCLEQSERWQQEVAWTNADVLVVGHMHTPFVRKIGNKTILNPGSLGQPKTGRPLACYALWEDGAITLKEYEYPLLQIIREIRAMPIWADDQNALIAVLQTGALPQRHSTTAELSDNNLSEAKP